MKVLLRSISCCPTGPPSESAPGRGPTLGGATAPSFSFASPNLAIKSAVTSTIIGRTDASVRIGVPKESWPGETLVAMTPKTADQLIKLGYELVIESGAGAAAKFADGAYETVGVRVAPVEEVWT